MIEQRITLKLKFMSYSIQQLQEMEYEELCSLVQQKEISWSEWVEAQPDLYEGYDQWLTEQELERNDVNALAYISQVEQMDLIGQIPDDLDERMQVVFNARKAMKE